MLQELLKTISAANPYGIQARNMGKFGLVPTTQTIDRMADWDYRDAVRRANEALNFYDLPEIPGTFSLDNPFYTPMAGAVQKEGRVPANLFQRALTEQKGMTSNQAVADFVKRLSGLSTDETPPHMQAAIEAVMQNPEALAGMTDPIFQHFGDVHAAQKQAETDRQIWEDASNLAQRLGMGEPAQLFSNPATREIGLDVLRSMFSSGGAKGRGSLSVIEDDEKFLKEFRARYQSYIKWAQDHGMPSMSEPEFAVSLGREVYDRYNLAINPARGGVAGIPGGAAIQQAENIKLQFGGNTEEALMNAIRNQNVSPDVLNALVDMYNRENPGNQKTLDDWLQEWVNRQTGKKGLWERVKASIRALRGG